MIYAIIYAIGYFISLHAMHRFKVELGIDHYDPPHEGWYDDYDSNAEAYVSISFAWPIFWFGMGLGLIWKGLLKISNRLDTK